MSVIDRFASATHDCGAKLRNLFGGVDDVERDNIGEYASFDANAVDGLRNLQSLTSSRFIGFSSSTTALQLCFVNVSIYLCLAVVAFSFIFEKWSIIDSLYFAVVTFTTIGYGDMSPTTLPGQIFTILFALYGISILGVFLGIIGERIVEAQSEALKQAEERARTSVMEMFSNTENGETPEQQSGDDVITRNSTADDETKNKETLWTDMKDLLVHETPIACVIVGIGMVIGYFEGWSPSSSLYYAIITFTTVGYGDLVPTRESMRLLAIFFLPLAVAVFGAVLGRIAGYYMDRQTKKAEKEFLHRQVTLSDLAVMDTDGDGGVSYGEFLAFMMVAMQKVDQKSVDEVKAVFQSLDADGSGTLQKEDLILLVERKKNKQRMGELV